MKQSFEQYSQMLVFFICFVIKATMTFSLAICYKSDSDEADSQQQQRLLSDLYYYYISYIKFSLAVYYKETLMKQTFSIPKRL